MASLGRGRQRKAKAEAEVGLFRTLAVTLQDDCDDDFARDIEKAVEKRGDQASECFADTYTSR